MKVVENNQMNANKQTCRINVQQFPPYDVQHFDTYLYYVVCVAIAAVFSLKKNLFPLL